MNSKQPLLPDDDLSPLRRLIPWLAILWLVIYWFLFFTTRLPNASNADRELYRSDILFNLPELLGELISGDPSPHSGWKNLPQRYGIIALAMVIVAAAFSTGNLLLRAMRLDTGLDRTSHLALAGGVGLSVVSLFTLGCGQLGMLWQSLFAAVFGMVILAELALQWKSRQKSDKRPHSPRKPYRWLGLVCLLVSIPFLCCMLLGSVLPPTDFDVKEYHLGGPKEYFLAGRVQFLPHNVYTSFPFLTEMLLLAGMVLRGDWENGALVGQAVLMAFAPIAALGVAGVARRVGGEAAGWLAALAYLSIPWTYRISIIAYTEGALCAYVVLTLLAFLLWRERRGITGSHWNTTGTVLLGMLAGSAVATKYPGMILVVIPFAIAGFVTATRTPGATVRTVVPACLLYLAGVLITFGPWMFKNLIETGNPVYPLLYSLFGGVDWNEELQAKWKAGHPPLLLTPGWYDLRGVLFANDWQSPLLFGLAPLAFLQARKRQVVEVAGYALVLLAGWYLFTHRLDRFWVPMNSVMAVLAGCGLAAILGWNRSSTEGSPSVSPKKKSTRHTPPGTFDVVTLVKNGVVFVLIASAVLYNFVFVTTPLGGYNAYFMDYATARAKTETRSVTLLKEMELPPDSKVLFVGEAELFDAKFPYAYSTVFDQNLLELWTADKTTSGEWTMRSRQEILKKLHEEGIDYVLVNWNEVLRYRTTYGFTDYVTPERFEQLVKMGILSPTGFFKGLQEFRPWDRLDPRWQQEIERWAPSLKVELNQSYWMLQFQVFMVNPTLE
ncbi:MAG TPA: hypothetical protein VNQ76_05195 [Planctomicrobium sp.]|nr:hypothetical protein [Planctomicrobium sp.]